METVQRPVACERRESADGGLGQRRLASAGCTDDAEDAPATRRGQGLGALNQRVQGHLRGHLASSFPLPEEHESTCGLLPGRSRVWFIMNGRKRLPNRLRSRVFGCHRFRTRYSLAEVPMVTMTAVARQAGRSITTVSHVLNGTRYARDETRQHVLDSIAHTHYFPTTHE